MHLKPLLLSASLLSFLTLTTAHVVPTKTTTSVGKRAVAKVPPIETSEPGTSTLNQLLPRTPPIVFRGFNVGQILVLKRAIIDAAWLGQMGQAELANINSVNDLSPSFRTYFGPQFAAGRLDIIRRRVILLPKIRESLD